MSTVIKKVRKKFNIKVENKKMYRSFQTDEGLCVT
jgi:hypothetical protein